MKIYTSSQMPEDTFFSSDLSGRVLNEFIMHLPLITRFCKDNNVKVSSLEVTSEKGYEELLCVFNDDFGGYTVNGIRDSLKK